MTVKGCMILLLLCLIFYATLEGKKETIEEGEPSLVEAIEEELEYCWASEEESKEADSCAETAEANFSESEQSCGISAVQDKCEEAITYIEEPPECARKVQRIVPRRKLCSSNYAQPRMPCYVRRAVMEDINEYGETNCATVGVPIRRKNSRCAATNKCGANICSQKVATPPKQTKCPCRAELEETAEPEKIKAEELEKTEPIEEQEPAEPEPVESKPASEPEPAKEVKKETAKESKKLKSGKASQKQQKKSKKNKSQKSKPTKKQQKSQKQ